MPVHAVTTWHASVPALQGWRRRVARRLLQHCCEHALHGQQLVGRGRAHLHHSRAPHRRHQGARWAPRGAACGARLHDHLDCLCTRAAAPLQPDSNHPHKMSTSAKQVGMEANRRTCLLKSLYCPCSYPPGWKGQRHCVPRHHGHRRERPVHPGAAKCRCHLALHSANGGSV